MTANDASSDPIIAFFGRWGSVVTAVAAIAGSGIAQTAQVVNALLDAQGSAGALKAIKADTSAFRIASSREAIDRLKAAHEVPPHSKLWEECIEDARIALNRAFSLLDDDDWKGKTEVEFYRAGLYLMRGDIDEARRRYQLSAEYGQAALGR